MATPDPVEKGKQGPGRGRRLESTDPTAPGDPSRSGRPTWRGWLVGILSVAILCKAVPVTDYVLRGTFLSLNTLPFSSIFLTFAHVMAYNLGLSHCRHSLGLSIQDIALVFGMTMVANHIPGHGLMGFLVAEMAGPIAYATPENLWEENLHPLIPDA